jgi:DNA-binding CsgD family transcriptional regulator
MQTRRRDPGPPRDLSQVIGRDEERAALTAFLEGELPAALVLAGEPGIGKTTLWRATLMEAASRGFQVVSCSPSGTETELGLAALRDLLDASYDKVESGLPSPQRRALDIALLRADAEGRAAERAAVGQGVLSVLRALTREAPLVVAVDDVQWLDRASASALEFALRRVRDEPVALLLALRLKHPLPLELERAAWFRSWERLDLSPLDLESLHRLLVPHLRITFPRPLLRRVHELSGGNPFFALELSRAVEPGTTKLRLPHRLHELVRDRLTSLPPATLHAVQVAAALSRPTVETVLATVDADRAVFDAAVEADVLAIEDREIRFTHPLVASAAYELLTPSRLRDLHERLARLLSDPEERARHLAVATAAPDELVAAAIEEGAAVARARGARAAAADLLEHAARLTPQSQLGESRRRRADAGTLHFESGDNRRGRAVLEALAAELSPGPERARVVARLALTRAYDDDLDAATDLFLEAAREARDDTRTRAEALSHLAGLLFRRRERLAEAVTHAKSAVALSRGLDDVALLADAFGQQLLAEAALGRPEAAQTMDELLGLRDATAQIRLLSHPRWIAAIVRMWWEDFEWAARVFAETIELGRASGEEALLPYVYVLAAQNECVRGRFDDAASAASAGYEIAEQAGETTLASYALALLALADAHRGRVDAARQAGRRALELAGATHGRPTYFFAASALGFLELSLGNVGAAAEQLEPIVRMARRESIREPGMTRFVVDYAEALVELGRTDEAAEIAQAYEDESTTRGRRGALGSALRCRALVLGATGESEAGLALLVRSRAEHHAASLPFERARTLLAQGATLRRARRRREARETLVEAKAEFERLGAAVWAERTGQELARISGRARADDGLTPTELRVAELVAEGASNKEVAAALFVSTKTIEGHPSRIYAKLGVRSRTELAHRLR